MPSNVASASGHTTCGVQSLTQSPLQMLNELVGNLTAIVVMNSILENVEMLRRKSPDWQRYSSLEKQVGVNGWRVALANVAILEIRYSGRTNAGRFHDE
jgi:hypothetical protein